MRRAPVDRPKKKHRKGLWSPDEDQRLRDTVMKHGHACWSSVPIYAGLQRNGKSCRLRWINYLRPGLKRGAFTVTEEETVFTLHRLLGNKWSQIAQHLPGRTDNEIKNYWHSYMKKRVAKTAATQAEDDYRGGLQISTSSGKANPSFELLKRSATDADETMQRTDYKSLPKVLFAEWLSFDQCNQQAVGSCSGSLVGFEDNLENHSSNVGDTLLDDLLQDEGTFGAEANAKAEVDEMLESPLTMEERGMLDYFPGEFCINVCDDMYA